MGKPVALEARADERDTRGFISMAIMSPFCGLIANWMLEPPVSTLGLISRMMARAASHPLIFLVRQRRAWATVMLSPVWTPMGSKFSILHTMTTLSARSRITSSSYSFQPMTGLLDEDLADGTELEAAIRSTLNEEQNMAAITNC